MLGDTIDESTALCARSTQNPVRIRCPKIDKLACQAQGARIFAMGEIPRWRTLRGAFLFGGAIDESTALCAQNSVRIRRPKIDKLACQAQGARIFAFGEIPRWRHHPFIEAAPCRPRGTESDGE